MKNFILIILIAVSVFFASCSRVEEPDDRDLVELSIRMKWFFSGTMSHFFYGKDLHVFEKNGIDLRINPGGLNNNSIKLVAAGSDILGVTSADESLIAIQKGIPIKIIGTLFYKSPIVFISKKNRGLDKFENIIGKKVEIDYGSNAEVQFRAFAEFYGIKKGDYFEEPYTYNLIPFIGNKVDYSVAYEMDQVNTLQSKGISLNIFRPEEAGIALLGDVLFCKQDYFNENKEIIDKFLNALENAIKKSIQHPEEATNALIKYSDGLDFESQNRIYRDTIKYLSYKDQILSNNSYLWDKTFEFLKNQGLIDTSKLSNWKTYVYGE